MLPHPVVFVPGITASYLKDFYPLPPEAVWSVLKKQYPRVSLHPDAPDYESRQPAMIRPDQIFEVAYKELIEELRDELEDAAGNEVPVYPFSYDWRQPLEHSQDELAQFVTEVVDRTRLMRPYVKAYGNDIKVNLIGHSMGGLVISRMLTDQPPGLPVNKVATLATPFKGSFEAIVKLTVGTGNLGKGKPSHAERRSARVTPALYQLLPAFKRGLHIDNAFPQTLFEAASWQPSLLASLTKYVRKTGLPGAPPPRERAVALFDRMLKMAKDNAAAIDSLDLAKHGLKAEDWLAVIGVDAETRVRQTVSNTNGKPSYVFDHKHDVLNRWDDANPPRTWWLTGDGTVPFEGAVPPFLDLDRLVLITPDDYGFWELGDKALSAFGGFHGILPNMNLVQRLLLRFLTDRKNQYDNTWGRAVPGVARWNPPMTLNQRNAD